MIIPIKRYYVHQQLEVEMLLNTRYMIRIEPTNTEENKPKTRIVMEGFGTDDASIVYTNETVATIKSKLTRARKVRDE